MNGINNNINFQGLKYSKSTQKLLEARGEWSEFKKIMPEMERKAKNTNIKFDVNHDAFVPNNRTILSCEIKPKNNLLSNPITRALGLAKKQYSGEAYYPLNDKRSTSKLFQDIYQDAYNVHRDRANNARKA